MVKSVESYDLVYTPPMRGLVSKHVTWGGMGAWEEGGCGKGGGAGKSFSGLPARAVARDDDVPRAVLWARAAQFFPRAAVIRGKSAG